jgi:hypothetical protein
VVHLRHRPACVSAYPSKPTVGAEVAQVPETEVVPRLVAPAEQLAAGQIVEVTGLAVGQAPRVRSEVKKRLGPDYSIDSLEDDRATRFARYRSSRLTLPTCPVRLGLA